MKKLLLYCTLFIFLTHAKAQKSPEYLWGRNAGDVAISSGYGNKIHSVSIFQDSASINGQTFIGSGGNDILITQSTSTGQHIWTKHYGGIYDEYVYAITTDINGNIYISGQFSTQTIFGNDTLNGSGSDNIFLLKLDKSGTVIWCKAITDGYYNHIQNNIAADNSGNILMSASITIGDGDTITLGQDHFIGDNSEDIYLIKYSSDGDIVWAKREGGNKNDRTYGITTDKDNNIYTSGYFTDTAYFGHGMYTSHTPQGSIYFAKYDSSGNIQYLKTPKRGGNGTGLDITFSDDGYLYMCGTVSDTTVLGNDTIKPTSNVALLVKYDEYGNVIWAKQYPSTKHQNAFRVITDNNNDIYLVILYGNTSLAKFSKDGDLVWSNETIPPAPWPVSVQGISRDKNGGIFITGTYDNKHNIFGNDTLYSSSQGLYQPGYIAKVGAYPLTIERSETIPRYTLYPNPNNGIFQISGNDLKGYFNYEVVNTSGQVAYKSKIQIIDNSVPISIQELPPGLYILKMYSKKDVYSISFQLK